MHSDRNTIHIVFNTYLDIQHTLYAQPMNYKQSYTLTHCKEYGNKNVNILYPTKIEFESFVIKPKSGENKRHMINTDLCMGGHENNNNKNKCFFAYLLNKH